MNTNTHKPLLLFAILVTIGGYFYIAIPECTERWAMCFQSIAPAPFRYRVLSVLLERLITPDGVPHMILLADIVIHFVAVVVVYLGLWCCLRQHVSVNTAIIGVFLLCAVWLFSYWFYLKTIYTVLELACIVLALLAVRSRLLLYAALVIVASLNRETGFFLALIWMAAHAENWRTRAYWQQALTLWVTFAAVTIALRMALGYADHILGVGGTLAYNLGDLRDTLIINVIIAPVWYMLAQGYRHAPATLKRLALVGVLYLGAIVVMAAWNELARLTLPIMPLVLPVILYPIDSQTRGNRV